MPLTTNQFSQFMKAAKVLNDAAKQDSVLFGCLQNVVVEPEYADILLEAWSELAADADSVSRDMEK